MGCAASCHVLGGEVGCLFGPRRCSKHDVESFVYGSLNWYVPEAVQGCSCGRVSLSANRVVVSLHSASCD
jgi:hypothetical protein